MNIFNTEVFQGNLTKKNYFEGWYYKHVSADRNSVLAFIPGISLAVNNPHSFIQIIDGITGETHYISYKLEDFSGAKDKHYVKVGKSIFTDKFIDIDIEDESICVKGRLEYTDITKYPKSLLSPGIMGWYSYIPFMECNHGIVSVNHNIKGNLTINKNTTDFSNGKGYIEKDWGASFPEAWIWLHSNSFTTTDSSLFVSIAKIPWLGKYFMGFICFFYHNGIYYKFSTYNNSKISFIKFNGNNLSIVLVNKKYLLKINAILKGAGELKAPALGEMSRRIKESIDSEVHIQLTDKNNKIIVEEFGTRAGLEIIEKIFEYF